MHPTFDSTALGDSAPFAPRFGWKRRINCIRQTEVSECGLACIAMIAHYYGNNLELSELRERFSASSNGVRLSALIEMGNSIGFQSRGLRAELSELYKIRTPYIAHFDLNHYVVICSVTKRHIEVADPAFGKRKLAWREFSDHFTGVVLELSPTSNFTRSAPQPRLSIPKLVFSPVGVKKALLNIFLISLLLELLALVAPLAAQVVIDHVIADNDFALLNLVAGAFTILLILQVLASAIRSWSTAVLSLSLNIAWTGRIFSHLLKLPESYFARRHLGDVVSRFGSLDVIQQSVANKSVEIIIDGIMAVLSLSMIIYYSGVLATLAGSALLLSLLARVVSYNMMQETNISQITLMAKQQSAFLEAVRGTTEIKLYNGTGSISTRYLNRAVASNNASAAFQSLFIIFGAVDSFLFGFLKILVLFIGAKMALMGAFTAGMLVAFISYSDQFIGRIVALFDFGLQVRMLRVHADRLSDIVHSPVEPYSDIRGGEVPVDGSIELIDVSFRYSENEPWIIRHCSFRIEAGESIAIVGSSGCGKSTLLKIMSGLLEPTSGTVRVGNRDLKLIGKSVHRDYLTAVMQDSILFAGNITDNISFFDQYCDQATVESSAVAAGIHDDILSFPMRYQTSLGDMGSSLSGGQRQRICLARALYRNPRVLLLDEATNQLDVEKEREIIQKILAMNLTPVIVSHRPETANYARRKLFMTEGTLELAVT